MTEKRAETKDHAIVFGYEMIASMADDQCLQAIAMIEEGMQTIYDTALSEGMRPSDVIGWMQLWTSEEMLRLRCKTRHRS